MQMASCTGLTLHEMTSLAYHVVQTECKDNRIAKSALPGPGTAASPCTSSKTRMCGDQVRSLAQGSVSVQLLAQTALLEFVLHAGEGGSVAVKAKSGQTLLQVGRGK